MWLMNKRLNNIQNQVKKSFAEIIIWWNLYIPVGVLVGRCRMVKLLNELNNDLELLLKVFLVNWLYS